MQGYKNKRQAGPRESRQAAQVGTTFESRLTQKLINHGTATYVSERRSYVIAVGLFILLFLAILYMKSAKIAFVILALWYIGVSTALWLFYRRRFSVGEVTRYRLGENELEISGEDGVHAYAYRKIKMVEDYFVIGVFLPRGAFKILGVEDMSEEQQDFLRKKGVRIRKAYKGRRVS